MSVLNIILLLTGYSSYIKPSNIYNFNKFSVKMNNDNMFNMDDVLGLKLFKPNDTKELTIKWLYKTLEDPTIHPSFIIDDVINTLAYSVKKTDKSDLFIAYMPNSYDNEPQFIGYFSIKPDKKILSIEQICTNPFIKDPSLTDYKNRIQILARKSNVLLSPKPLKYIVNPRYYLEFTQSF